MGDEAFRAALREAISEVAREHLVDASRLGEVSGFLVSFAWKDVTAAHGDHLVVSGQDAREALDRVHTRVFKTGQPAPRFGQAGRSDVVVHPRRRSTD